MQKSIDKNHKQQDSTRRLLSLLIISLIVMLAIVSVFWYQEKQQAQDERQQVLDLINYMNVDLRDKLEPIGKLDIIEGVQRRINQYFDNIDINPNNPEALQQKAIALAQYTITLNQQGKSKQKQVEQGLLQANHLFQQTVQQQPDKLQWQRDLSVSYEKLGDFYQQTGDIAKVAQYYQDSLNIIKKLVSKDPDNMKWQRGLSVSYNKLGVLALQTGDKVKAAQYYQDSLDIVKKLVSLVIFPYPFK